MYAAMDVGVVVLVVAHNRVDHCLRLLGGRSVVEIDERLAVRHLVEDGEILPYLLHVVSIWCSVNFRRLQCGAHPASSQFRSVSADCVLCSGTAEGRAAMMSCSKWSRTAPSFIRSRHSFAKASSRR